MKRNLDDQWPELSSLLGGYFNQDFDEDYAGPEAVVEGFRDEESPENARAAAEQARALANSGADDDELGAIMNDLGLSYAYGVDGWTSKAWLLHVAEVLESRRPESS